MICTNLQRLVLLSGRVSMSAHGIALLAGLVERLGDEFRRLVHELAVDRMLHLRATATTMVFSILLLTTTPIRSLFLRFLSIVVAYLAFF